MPSQRSHERFVYRRSDKASACQDGRDCVEWLLEATGGTRLGHNATLRPIRKNRSGPLANLGAEGGEPDDQRKIAWPPRIRQSTR